MKSLAGRSCHLVSIFHQNLHLTLRSHHFTSFFRQISDFCAIDREEGHTTCFLSYKRQEHTSKMRETCKSIQWLITQLRHLLFSYGIISASHLCYRHLICDIYTHSLHNTACIYASLPIEPTLLVLMHQSLYCTQHRTKPKDPRCMGKTSVPGYY